MLRGLTENGLKSGNGRHVNGLFEGTALFLLFCGIRAALQQSLQFLIQKYLRRKNGTLEPEQEKYSEYLTYVYSEHGGNYADISSSHRLNNRSKITVIDDSIEEQ